MTLDIHTINALSMGISRGLAKHLAFAGMYTTLELAGPRRELVLDLPLRPVRVRTLALEGVVPDPTKPWIVTADFACSTFNELDWSELELRMLAATGVLVDGHHRVRALKQGGHR